MKVLMTAISPSDGPADTGGLHNVKAAVTALGLLDKDRGVNTKVAKANIKDEERKRRRLRVPLRNFEMTRARLALGGFATDLTTIAVYGSRTFST
jgi:hypothetical protein